MTILSTVAVNGQPIESLGLVGINLREFLSPPTVKLASTDLVGRMGSVPALRGIKYSPRPLMLGVANDSGTMIASRNAMGAWYYALQGQLEIEIVDAPGRVCYGYFESAQADPFGITLLSSRYQAVGVITCYDPFWYNRKPISFGGAANTRLVVPSGTAPSRIRMGIAGPFTTPTVTMRDRAGNPLGTMPFTRAGGMTAADNKDWIDIDLHNQNIDHWVNQVRSAKNNGYQYLDSAHGYLVADPLDGPTFEVDSGYLSGLAWEAFLV